MKVLLTAINTQYIHTNLALRSLKAYVQTHFSGDISSLSLELCEFTINHRFEFLLESLYRAKPDILCFSCYLWNIGLIRDLIREYRKICPQVTIVLGGPEISYEPLETMRQCPEADFLIAGEGEQAFCALLQALTENRPFSEVPSLFYRENGEILHTKQAPPLDLNELSFCYEDTELSDGRILYYESMRGCPFSCQYCLSSAEKGVRFRPLSKVFSDLSRFLQKKVPQVKFVDRTFNCSKKHGLEILRFLQQNDNGVTNFHFEIAAHLLDEDWFSCLQTARPGLFQFEIGVQSTHAPTIQAIQRATDFDKISDAVNRIRPWGNIHLHLDLIAGLPFEDFQTFTKSFNEVYALHPAQFQLGFLKLLKGSGLRRDAGKYGIVYQDKAPYEVLSTDFIGFDELLQLKEICRMVELFYNSCRFGTAISYLERQFSSPFALYGFLAKAYRSNRMDAAPHRNDEMYSFLAKAWEEKTGKEDPLFRCLLLHDCCLHEKPRKIPAGLQSGLTGLNRKKINAFYCTEAQERRCLPEYSFSDSHALAKLCHIEVYPFDPMTLEEKETAVAYNYEKRDLFGNASPVVIELP